MKRLIGILIFLVSVLSIQAQDVTKYSRVKISLEGKNIHNLAQIGIDVTEGVYIKDVSLETDLSSNEINLAKEAGFELGILIDDVSKFYSERAAAEMGLPILRSPADEFPVPQNWGYGSMGGYYTFQEVMNKIDFMAAQWPDLVSVKQPINGLNPTINGNQVYFVKISDNVNINEDEPEVLYTALIHAREAIGVQQMMYYMLYLLENYDSDPNVKALVDHTEMYFVPVVNPDGYIYNQQISPNGGGDWRKNRRLNTGGSYGVDLNRNFGYKWGLNNTGSSPDPTSNTYRGTAAFSEAETDNLRQFCEQHEFVIALNYHSYSNLLLYPWGYTDIPCPDDDIFAAHSLLMTRDSHYTYGPGSSTIYPTNGGSDDYMYGDTLIKNAIFSYTPEVGSSNDGFWPSVSRIIPLCQENMIQNVMAARLAGAYAKVTENAPSIIGEKQFMLSVEIQRLGFGEADSYTVSVLPVDDQVIQTGNPIEFNQLDMLQTAIDSISITLNDAITTGQMFRFVLQLDNGSYILSDTITKMFGVTSLAFFDPCDDLTNWTTTNWGVTTSSYFTAPASITDSPNGQYPSNTNSTITLTQAIEVPNTTYASLSFWAKWDLEATYDYVQLLIKPTGSINWAPLEGKYTKPGTNNQAPGQPLYDGVTGWVQEEIDLSTYAGSNVQLRFLLKTDGSVTGDGFYFDDMRLLILDIETALPATKENTIKLKVYPNPVTSMLMLDLGAETDKEETLEIIDARGQVLISQSIESGRANTQIETSKLAAGMYFVRIKGQAQQLVRFVKN